MLVFKHFFHFSALIFFRAERVKHPTIYRLCLSYVDDEFA